MALPKKKVVLHLGKNFIREGNFMGLNKTSREEAGKIKGKFTPAEIGAIGRQLGWINFDFPVRHLPQKLLSAVEKEYTKTDDQSLALEALLSAVLLYQESMGIDNVPFKPTVNGFYEWLNPVDFGWQDLNVLRSFGFTSVVTHTSQTVPIYIAERGKTSRAISKKSDPGSGRKNTYGNEKELSRSVFQGLRYHVPRVSELGLLSVHAWEARLLELFTADLRTSLANLKRGNISQDEVNTFLGSIFAVIKTKSETLPGVRFSQGDEWPSSRDTNNLLINFRDKTSRAWNYLPAFLAQ